MQRHHVLAAAAALALAAAPLGARAEPPPTVQAEGTTSSLACGTSAATVFGKRNFTTFTGACAGLTVRGDGNQITIALRPGAPIDIAGSDNQVHISAGRGGAVHVSGSNTLLVADGGTAPTAAGSVISGDGQTIQLECAGVAVTLDGNHSRFHLHGGCRSLLLRGAGNVVDAEMAPAATIRVEGDGSVVIWRLASPGAAPVATVLGAASLVQSDSTAQSPAPTAPAAGVTPEAQIMAALQGEVTPDGTRFHLPQTMFEGNALAQAGQVALAQISQLVGVIHPAGLRIEGQAPQHLAAVQSWLAERGLVRSPMRIAVGPAPDGVDVTILR